MGVIKKLPESQQGPALATAGIYNKDTGQLLKPTDLGYIDPAKKQYLANKFGIQMPRAQQPAAQPGQPAQQPQTAQPSPLIPTQPAQQ
jgi:hypothetical protein